MTRVLRGAAALLVALALVLAVPVPAAAHDELTGTNPADGATVATRLDEVTLTFSGVVRADGSTVTVTGADGTAYHDGSLSVLDRVVHQPVASLGSGAYRVQWRVLAADGHAMSGEFGFTLALPPELEPAPSPTPSPTPPASPALATTATTATTAVASDQTSGSGPWVGLLAGAAVLVALTASLLWARRRRGSA